MSDFPIWPSALPPCTVASGIIRRLAEAGPDYVERMWAMRKKTETDAEVLEWAALALSNKAEEMGKNQSGRRLEFYRRLRRTAKRLKEMAAQVKPAQG